MWRKTLKSVGQSDADKMKDLFSDITDDLILVRRAVIAGNKDLAAEQLGTLINFMKSQDMAIDRMMESAWQRSLRGEA